MCESSKGSRAIYTCVRFKCSWENLMEDLMEKLLLLSEKFPLLDGLV